MYIYIYYPYSNVKFFTVALNRQFEPYWQASQIFKALNLSKNVKTGLDRYMNWSERFYRIKDINESSNCVNYTLSIDQIYTLMNNIRSTESSKKCQFEEWFQALISGKQYLYPKNHKMYDYLIKQNPFLSKGLSVFCVDVSPNHSISPTVNKRDVTDTQNSATDDHEMTDDAANYPNPPSIYSECIPSPFPDQPDDFPKQFGFDPDYLFTLPTLLSYLQETFGGKKQSTFSTIPVVLSKNKKNYSKSNSKSETEEKEPKLSTPHPSFEPKPSTSSSISPPSTPPPNASSPDPIPAAAAATASPSSPSENIEPSKESDDLREEDPFLMDVDESKTFKCVDPLSKSEYKFHAVRLNYITEIRSIVINPFYASENNDTYLYFPVKKH